MNGRKPIDLSGLKCIVIDEADVFFLDEKNFEFVNKLSNFKNIKDNKNVQWILFSATYPQEEADKYEKVQERMFKIISEAQQIKLNPRKLKLDHIKQFVLKCEKGKKLDFIKDVFETCEMTQTFIFVNTLDFAERVH